MITADEGESSAERRDLVLHLAYAEASVMMLECLMRAMIERGLIRPDDLLQELETAIQSKRTMVAEKRHPEISAVAAGVLTRVANSLRAVQKGPGPHTVSNDPDLRTVSNGPDLHTVSNDP